MGGITRSWMLLALASATLSAVPGTGAAQDIIVTARRLEEREFDIPAKVDVILPDDIAAGGISDLQTLAARVPGLAFESIWGGANSFAVLRGLNQSNVAGDNVGIYVDGVYQANRDAVDVEMLDLSRIEVFHGPQSALFGHSTFAGVISYVAAEPAEQWGGSASVDLGSSSYAGLRGMVTGPVSNAFKLRLAGGMRRADGTWRNSAEQGQSLGNSSRLSFAGSLATRDAVEAVRMRLSARYGETRQGQPAFFPLDYRAYNCGSRIPGTSYWTYYCGPSPIRQRLSVSPDLPTSVTNSGQIALRIEAELGSISIRSETGLYRAVAKSFRDFDGSAMGEPFGVCLAGISCIPPSQVSGQVERLVNVQTIQHRRVAAREIAQDLRMIIGEGSELELQAGASLFRSRSQTVFAYGARAATLASNERLSMLVLADPARIGPLAGSNFALVSDPGTVQNVQNDAVESRHSYALFSIAEWAFSPRINLRGELRGNWTRFGLDSRRFNFQPSFGTALGRRGFFDVTTRFGLDVRPLAKVLAYASIARGSRSGGLNAADNLLPDEQAYDEESNWTSELGLRYAGDGLLQAFELTGYHVNWRNTQINGLATSPGVTALIIRNTRGIVTRGGEVSVVLAPARWLSFDLAANYTDPRFKEGSEDPGSGAYCGLFQGQTTSSFCVIRPSLVKPSQLVPDISGNTVWRAVRQQVAVGADIAPQDQRFMGLNGHIGLSYQGNQYERSINGLTYGRRLLLDASLELPLGGFSLRLWGTNLGGDRYIRASAGRPPFFYSNQPRPTDMILGEGRRVGISVEYSLP